MSTRFSQKLQDFEVSFDDKGNLTRDNLNVTRLPPGYVIKKNSFFYDKIQYIGYTISYSGKAKFMFKSLMSGATYCMFISDFDNILLEDLLNHKTIEGVFSFKKRGRKQGIRFVKS